MRYRGIRLNGGFTDIGATCVSYEDAKAHGSENSSNNAWIFNFSNGQVNNNNKYNSNYVRAVTAFGGWAPFLISMFEAFNECMKGKRTSPQAIEYMDIAYYDIELLAFEVYIGVYYPTTSTCFMVLFPKLREVFAAALRDRIIHHWICIRLMPLFEIRCIELGNVSHACRKGYGTSSAIKSVENGMMKISCNGRKEAWLFKGDIVGFFMNIRKDVMWSMLYVLITEEYHGAFKDILLRLTKIVVMHNPEKDCVINSPLSLWQEIEASKSMFYIDDNKGGPIGNLTTQLFAGYYMSFFDEFVEVLFRGKNYSYTRLVDDFTIICDDRRFLLDSIPLMRNFLKKKLFLEMHTDKIYFQPVSHGVKFVGVYIHLYRCHIINRTRGRMINKINGYIDEMRHGNLNEMDVRRIANVLNSYFGFLVHTRSYRIRHDIVTSLPSEFYRYFYIENFKVVKIKKKYKL